MTSLHRLSIVLLKYVPMICGFLMWINVTLLFCNVKTSVFESVCGYTITPCVVTMVWSRAFNFCPIHQCFTLYNTVVTGCIKWQNAFIGFGSMLLIMRILVWLAGLGLLIWYIISQCNKNYKWQIDSS